MFKADWRYDDVEIDTVWRITTDEPATDATDDSVRYMPTRAVVKFMRTNSTDEGDSGWDWRAHVEGYRVRADGTIGVREYTERFWSHHKRIPPWLQALADERMATLTAQ